MAIDTTDTALLIAGRFSFREESLDLTLLPRPKDMSPVSIRAPIKIGGIFADPSFAPKGGPLLQRGAAVAALASVAPPLALLALIETGPGQGHRLRPWGAAGRRKKSRQETVTTGCHTHARAQEPIGAIWFAWQDANTSRLFVG
jgi:hypothetical protein